MVFNVKGTRQVVATDLRRGHIVSYAGRFFECVSVSVLPDGIYVLLDDGTQRTQLLAHPHNVFYIGL